MLNQSLVGLKLYLMELDVQPDPSFSPLWLAQVARIVKAWRHPDADSLYIEEVDVGEAQPRQVSISQNDDINFDESKEFASPKQT